MANIYPHILTLVIHGYACKCDWIYIFHPFLPFSTEKGSYIEWHLNNTQ